VSNLVGLRAKLPKAEEMNGLDAIHDQLIADGKTPWAVLAIVDAYKIETDVATGNERVILEVRRIEPISKAAEIPGPIRDAVVALVDKRTGKQPLPFDQVERISSEPAD
jgi:hypothetical protein